MVDGVERKARVSWQKEGVPGLRLSPSCYDSAEPWKSPKDKEEPDAQKWTRQVCRAAFAPGKWQLQTHCRMDPGGHCRNKGWSRSLQCPLSMVPGWDCFWD